jgi:hypothetical protein
MALLRGGEEVRVDEPARLTKKSAEVAVRVLGGGGTGIQCPVTVEFVQELVELGVLFRAHDDCERADLPGAQRRRGVDQPPLNIHSTDPS